MRVISYPFVSEPNMATAFNTPRTAAEWPADRIMASDPVLGIVLSIVGALLWASQYLFVRVGMRKGSVMGAVFAALLVNLAIVLPIGVVHHYPDFGLTVTAAAAFALAGLSSGLFGRIFQYRSTEVIGASRTSPVVAASGLVSVVLAVALLGESLTIPHLIGVLLIVGGVVLISLETATDESTRPSSRRDSFVLFGLPLLAAVFYGIEPVLVRVGLESGTPLLVGMSIAVVTSFVGFTGYARLSKPITFELDAHRPALWWYLGAGFTGTISYLAYFAALGVAPVVVVMPIFQSVPLIVIALSVVFMPASLERVTRRVASAAAIVVVGATLVSLSA